MGWIQRVSFIAGHTLLSGNNSTGTGTSADTIVRVKGTQVGMAE